jgi:hypothetical protein
MGRLLSENIAGWSSGSSHEIILEQYATIYAKPEKISPQQIIIFPARGS